MKRVELRKDEAERKRVFLTINLAPDQYRQFKEQADKEFLPVSTWIKQTLFKALKTK